MRSRSCICWIGALLLLAATPALAASAAPRDEAATLAEPSGSVTIELYGRDGCPHCAEAEAYLQALAEARPDVELVVHDVARDPAARERMQRRAREAGIDALGVPMIAVSGQIIVGFDSAETTGRRLVELLDAAAAPPAPADPSAVCEAAPGAAACGEAEEVELPLLGHVRVRDLGLPLFTLIVGLLDGFNPCAMWVLLFLLSLLAGMRDRRRMAAIGGTFVLISGLVYFTFMAAWLNVFLLIGISRTVELVLGGVALLIGALNVKDAVALGRGPSLKIPESAKPGIYRRVRAIVQAKHVLGAVAAAAVLAVFVNIIELACTAGLPAVYTRVLTAHPIPAWSYYGYLLLYVAAYMFDDALMVTIALVTLSRTKLQERGGRALKLISGLVMLFLGLALIAFPRWLSW